MGVAILKQGLTKGPLSHDPEWFNKDDNYATAVQQALDLQLDVVSFVHQLAKQVCPFTAVILPPRPLPLPCRAASALTFTLTLTQTLTLTLTLIRALTVTLTFGRPRLSLAGPPRLMSSRTSTRSACATGRLGLG